MEHDNNRSSAFTAEQLAMLNTILSQGIKEAMQAIAPVLRDVALTPDKIRLMEEERRKLTPEQQQAADRSKRERERDREQMMADAQRAQAIKDSCPHQDDKGMEALCLVHNYPDRQPRGICPKCHSIIEPKHWEIDAPDPQTGKTRPVLKDASPNYHRVLAIAARS